MPRPVPVLALTHSTLVVSVCPSARWRWRRNSGCRCRQGLAGDGHRCDHRHRVRPPATRWRNHWRHSRRWRWLCTPPTHPAECSERSASRMPHCPRPHPCCHCSGIGVELLGVRIADRGAAADAAGGSHPAGRLDADAADAGRAVGDLHAVRGIHTLAIGIGGR